MLLSDITDTTTERINNSIALLQNRADFKRYVCPKCVSTLSIQETITEGKCKHCPALFDTKVLRDGIKQF